MGGATEQSLISLQMFNDEKAAGSSVPCDAAVRVRSDVDLASFIAPSYISMGLLEFPMSSNTTQSGQVTRPYDTTLNRPDSTLMTNGVRLLSLSFSPNYQVMEGYSSYFSMGGSTLSTLGVGFLRGDPIAVTGFSVNVVALIQSLNAASSSDWSAFWAVDIFDNRSPSGVTSLIFDAVSGQYISAAALPITSGSPLGTQLGGDIMSLKTAVDVLDSGLAPFMSGARLNVYIGGGVGTDDVTAQCLTSQSSMTVNTHRMSAGERPTVIIASNGGGTTNGSYRIEASAVCNVALQPSATPYVQGVSSEGELYLTSADVQTNAVVSSESITRENVASMVTPSGP